MKILAIVVTLLVVNPVGALEVLKDFDSLGGNEELLKKVMSDSSKKIELVQNRIVNRVNRWEISPEFKHVANGNTYLNSSSVGLSVRYHFNPYWTVGLKYNHFTNKLTPEGKSVMDDAVAAYESNSNASIAIIPELNWLKSSAIGLVSYYPIYGKANLFNKGIIHFDMYGTLGAGKMQLRNGGTTTFLGGVGFGFWISRYLTSRIEYNYQVYTAKFQSGKKRLGMNSVAFSVGLLL